MTEQKIKVTKRDGHLEELDIAKIHRVVEWAAKGLNVSTSQVEINSHIQFYNGIMTSDIHETLVKSAADLISTEAPDYQYMAARLALFHIRKIAFGEYNPPHLFDHVKKMCELGWYDKEIITYYTEEEFNELNDYIVHDRDLTFAYAGIKQMEAKYLVQNRLDKKPLESPQIAFMLIGACIFSSYPKETRMDYVKKFYDSLSKFHISLPTPVMAGVRTPTRQYSSCVLVSSGDSLDSINATTSAIVKYISQRAGIGINGGRIRALGSEIRGGEAVHTGVIPFWKMFQAAVKSCSQGAIRGGAATLYYPVWHLEVESLLVLKNNRGVEDNRIRQLDYGVQLNKLMYTRLIKDQDITLFSPHSVEGMYDAFFNDQELFEKLYTEAENNPLIPKKKIPARDLFSLLMAERANTGRIYIMNVDHCNTHSSFDEKVAPIHMSNLCVAGNTEILTDKGYVFIRDVAGTKQNVWNGHEWSEVDVVLTSSSSELIYVHTSNHRFLKCTPYHKFYIVDGYGKQKEVRAIDLKEGDKLIKGNWPVIDGNVELANAYVQGFASADGCTISSNVTRIDLYGDKKALVDTITENKDNITSIRKQNTSNQNDSERIEIRYHDLRSKNFVPDASYSLSSKLKWLAGWLDGDGCIYRNGENEAITGSSTNLEFLKEVRSMLETMGTTAKIVNLAEEGYRLLPDGKGGQKEYYCQATWRLLISSYDSQKLLDLGLEFNRLKINKREVQRNATQFEQIEAVIDLGEFDETYCFTEPKRHLGVFNGLLTGQCSEITLPTKPLENINDEEGLISLCTLAGVNLGKIEKLEDLEEGCDLLVRSLDELLTYQNYPVPAAKRATELYRSLGIGVINFAYYLAKNGKLIQDGSGLELTHQTFEALQYYLLKSSVQLSKEKGACLGFKDTKYAKGILPIDTYKKDIDAFAPFSLQYDWESLRKEIQEFGLRNATLSTQFPSESSSQVSNATNGIDIPRSPLTVKASKDGILKQIVPEYERLKDQYEYLWDDNNNQGFLKIVAIIQKFMDQAISTNTRYNPAALPNGKVPMKLMLQELMLAYKWGVKTLYYHHTNDGADDTQDSLDDGCAGGACKL